MISEMSDVSESDEDEGEERQMTEGEKREAQGKLVPGLAEDEWGQKPVAAEATQTSDDKRTASKLEPEKYDGASSDESDENMEMDGGEVVTLANDEGEVEMEGEMEEFLRFTREALGLSDEQYQDILSSRRKRGGESGLKNFFLNKETG
jgi:hypothetical protein